MQSIYNIPYIPYQPVDLCTPIHVLQSMNKSSAYPSCALLTACSGTCCSLTLYFSRDICKSAAAGADAGQALADAQAAFQAAMAAAQQALGSSSDDPSVAQVHVKCHCLLHFEA